MEQNSLLAQPIAAYGENPTVVRARGRFCESSPRALSHLSFSCTPARLRWAMARAVLLGLSVVLAACHASKAVEQAQRAARAGAWDEAVLYYERARDEHPDNIEYQMALDRARLEASRAHLSQARKYLERDELDEAASELERALGYDPTNRYAHDELAEIGRRQDASPSGNVSTDSSTDKSTIWEPIVCSTRIHREALGCTFRKRRVCAPCLRRSRSSRA